MKKIFPILVILLVLGVGGYFFMSSKGVTPKTNANVFTSIQDALSKSMSLKCVYQDEKGIQTTTYIKGGAVRVMMETAEDKEQPNSIIMKDKKMYMWNETSKTGFTYIITEPNVTPSENTDSGNNAAVLAGIEKYKDACKVEVIADSFFEIPTDVNFQDMSSFIKQVPKADPIKDESTGDAQQKALEELMKQITPEAGDGQ